MPTNKHIIIGLTKSTLIQQSPEQEQPKHHVLRVDHCKATENNASIGVARVILCFTALIHTVNLYAPGVVLFLTPYQNKFLIFRDAIYNHNEKLVQTEHKFVYFADY